MSAEVTEGKYPIELCRPGGPGAGIEGAIASDDDLTTARALYRRAVRVIPIASSCWPTAPVFWRGLIGRKRCRV